MTKFEDQWDVVRRTIEEAYIEGHLADKDLARKYAWPIQLDLTEDEKDEIGEFTVSRIMELIDEFNRNGEVEPRSIADYLINSVLASMIWQKQRVEE